ncbi:hypothetical protein ACQB60_44975 [Actinomycetota bacterium Odt1-20B]
MKRSTGHRAVPALAAALALLAAGGTAAASEGSGLADALESCRSPSGGTCYTAAQLRTAYGLDTLEQKTGGHFGRGRTIGIVDPVGSPNARTDLET